MIAAMVSALFLAVGVAMVLGAGLVALADNALRDDAGYVSGTATTWTSPGYAVQTEELVLHRGAASFDLPHRVLGTVRVTADPIGADGVFVGVARTADVRGYLTGVAHTTLSDPFDAEGADTAYADGEAPRIAPEDADIWATSASGTGSRTVTWEPEPGSWTLVVMNQDATAPVATDVSLAAELPGLHTVAAVLLVTGLVVGGLAGMGLWLVLRKREEAPRAARA